MRCRLLLLLLLVAPAQATAQSDVVRQSLNWLGYLATVESAGPWSALIELHERRWYAPFRVHSRAIRVNAIRPLSPSSALSFGLATFWQGAQAPSQPAVPLALEIRPHFQLEARRRAATSLGSRTRFEYRAFSRSPEGLAVDRFDHALRLRQMLFAERVVGRIGENPVTARVSDELMLMFGDRDFGRAYDQNRLQAGVTIPMGERTRIEVAYLWIWQGRRSGGVFDRDVLRLNLNQRFRIE